MWNGWRRRTCAPPGGEVPEDYAFQGAGLRRRPQRGAAVRAVRAGRDSLVTYNFMFPRDPGDERPGPREGRSANLPLLQSPCPSCTELLDELEARPSTSRSDSTWSPSPRRSCVLAFADDRGWRRLRLVSSLGTSFSRDYQGESPEGINGRC